jgi:hypothetical protein
MGSAYGTHARGLRKQFTWKRLNKKNQYEDVGLDGRIILKYVLKK